MANNKESADKKGYHVDDIPKGIIGESSKILEEVLELIDSEKQGVNIMTMVELSDLYGAIRHYIKKNFQGLTMQDLESMANVTERVFRNGFRT